MKLLFMSGGALLGTFVFWTPIIEMGFFKDPSINILALKICYFGLLASVIGTVILFYFDWKSRH